MDNKESVKEETTHDIKKKESEKVDKEIKSK